jgi:hypothetical protein
VDTLLAHPESRKLTSGSMGLRGTPLQEHFWIHFLSSRILYEITDLEGGGKVADCKLYILTESHRFVVYFIHPELDV